jgi:2-polyprenyl-3-methyl-5-hydroxy-6-metoxy-1,4-benzoquinol methylase
MKKNAYNEMFAVEDQHWWYITIHNLVTLLSRTQFSRGPLKILDAGCGTGGLLSILSEAGHDVEGFDCSEVALEFCSARGLDKVTRADLNDWIPDPKTYDLILSMDVLYHEWVRDQVKVLRNLSGGLKEDGLIMVNYPAFPILSRHHDRVVMVRERYTTKTLKKYLAEAGLAPVLLSYRLPHAFFYLICLRLYEASRKNEVEAKSDIANIPSGFINRFLIQIGKLENRLIARGISMPFGSSLFVVAKRAG